MVDVQGPGLTEVPWDIDSNPKEQVVGIYHSGPMDRHARAVFPKQLKRSLKGVSQRWRETTRGAVLPYGTVTAPGICGSGIVFTIFNPRRPTKFLKTTKRQVVIDRETKSQSPEESGRHRHSSRGLRRPIQAIVARLLR